MTGWPQTPAATNMACSHALPHRRVARRQPERIRRTATFFAHAALATGKSVYDQRAARAGFGLAEATTGPRARYRRLVAIPVDDVYRAKVVAREFRARSAFMTNESVPSMA